MENNDACNIRRWDILKRQLKNLNPTDFLAHLKQMPEAILIDVRTPAEFSEGTLPNAINMDFLGSDYWEAFDQLDRSRPTFVFCRSGRRSVRTVMFMKNGGFHQVYNLDGGLNALREVIEDAIVVPVG